MENEIKADTVTIEAPTEIKVEAPVLPTREELEGKGWSKTELDKGEAHGMVAKSGAAPAPVPPVKKDEAAPEPKKDEAKPKPVGSLPEFGALTPEQEKVFTDMFGAGTPQRALYFRMKNERSQRQAAEARERTQAARLAALEEIVKGTKPKAEEITPENDPDNQPLTPKRLKEIQEAEAAELQRLTQEQNERHTVLVAAQTEQEEYARSVYTDFDATVTMAKEVMQNIDALVPDKRTQTKIVKLVRELQIAAANADKLGLDDDHAAMIAYEIGKFNPKYGKTIPDPTGTPKNPKPNGGLTPEQMKRVEQNTQRRGSGAAVPSGGGKRTIAVDEVDLATLNGMNYAERRTFREKHPEQYAKLMRG